LINSKLKIKKNFNETLFCDDDARMSSSQNKIVKNITRNKAKNLAVLSTHHDKRLYCLIPNETK
jgi:hypothetical protein